MNLTATIAAAPPLPASGPVIPTFGKSSCPSDGSFCWSWVGQHWGNTLAPALIQHIYIVLIAVAFGLVITMIAALIAYRFGWFEKGFSAFSTLLYTIPSLAFFLLFVPISGIGLTTVELGLTGYTFLLLFRNTVTGLHSAPPEAIAAATGMGMTPRQVLFRINLPLAIPAIMAGLRISLVTAISLATIAADVTPLGLGAPIFEGLGNNDFTTELVSAGVLAIALALVADALLVLLRRLVTPWIRAQAKGVG